MSDALKRAAQAALDALTCSGDADDPGHRCGHCDDYVDRNGVVRAMLRAALAEPTFSPEELVRMNEAWRHSRLMQAPEAEPPTNHGPIRETDIYDFAGWLTSRPGTLTVGSSHEAGPMAEAVGEYIRTFPERFAAPIRRTRPKKGSFEAVFGHLDMTPDDVGNWIIELKAEIEALKNPVQGEPVGYRLVPVEPTERMIAAIPWPTSVTPRIGVDMYKAMLAAAAPAPGGEHE